MKHYKTISQNKVDIEIGYKEPNQTLKDAAERLKGKELFKESNDRARQILSEIKSLPIQETLEEVAERLYPHCGNVLREMAKETFINGAKWQQERMYSEEEVLQLVSDWTDYRMSEDAKSKVTFKKYLEQFKKK